MATTKKKYYAVFGKSQNELAERKRSPDEPLHIWSWNVAGLRGCVKVGYPSLVSVTPVTMPFPFRRIVTRRLQTRVLMSSSCKVLGSSAVLEQRVRYSSVQNFRDEV